MNFPKRLAPEWELGGMIREPILMSRNPPHWHLANHLRSLLCFLIDNDLIRSMNLIVGQNAILKHKPAWTPTFPVVHPLIEYTTNTIPNNIVDLNVNRRLPKGGMPCNHLSSKNTPVAKPSRIATTKTPIMRNPNRRIRSGSDRNRRRSRWNMKVGHRIRRFLGRRVIRDSRDTAERMHRENFQTERWEEIEKEPEVKATSWEEPETGGGGIIDSNCWNEEYGKKNSWINKFLYKEAAKQPMAMEILGEKLGGNGFSIMEWAEFRWKKQIIM